LIAKGSSEKRQKQNQKRRLHNRIIRSEVKTSVKKYLVAIEEKNKEKAEASLKSFVSMIDGAVTKGVYHKNTAARKKSRMHRLLNKIIA